MKTYANSDDRVLDLVSESLARQTLCSLLEIQAERARLQLQRERKDSDEFKRILATSAVIGVLLYFWF